MDMSSEALPLESLCSLVVDCPHSTPTWTKSGHIVLRNQNIRNGRLDLSAPSFTDAEHFAQRNRRATPTSGDIVITREAPMGEVCMIPEGLECCLGQRQVLLRPDPRLVNPKFLLFALQSPEVQRQIGWNEGTGSTVSNLRIPILKSLKIPTPERPLQDAAAATLGVIDDRIDNLRQTNATLEAIAQTLFKSWFVDFDPVRAKAEGREPEGMDAATAALLPSEFVASELGLIPKSWTVGSIYDVADVRYGAPFKSALFNADRVGRPLVRIRDLRNEEPGVWTPEEHPKGYLIQPGDVIVGMDGEFRAYLWGGDEAWLNQRVCAFHPREPHGSVFVRNVISPLLARVESTVTATTVIHLGKKHIDEFRVLVPPPEIARIFCVMAQPLYERVVIAKQQARTLANLRDTLLPRLVSDKFRLPDAEREIEAAVA